MKNLWIDKNELLQPSRLYSVCFMIQIKKGNLCRNIYGRGIELLKKILILTSELWFYFNQNKNSDFYQNSDIFLRILVSWFKILSLKMKIRTFQDSVFSLNCDLIFSEIKSWISDKKVRFLFFFFRVFPLL